MRALVTGSRGFIGCHLIKALTSDDRFIAVAGVSRQGGECLQLLPKLNKGYGEFNCDIKSELEVAALMHHFRPDIVFHLAAIPIVKPNDIDPTAISEVNILGTHRLLHYAPLNCKFVLASSATVYGDQGKDTLCNEDLITKPTSVYGSTKVAAEALLQAYCSLGKIKGVCLRYVANVGKGATHGVIKDIITKLRSDTYTLDLLGDSPGSIKPYTHVYDTVSATILAAFCENDCHTVYNIAVHNILCVADLANIAMQVTGIKKKVKWLGIGANWLGDNRIVRVDATRIHRLGWKPTYDCSEKAVEAAVKEML